MVSAMHDRVLSKQFESLDKCLDFCDWVLSHSEHSDEMGANHSDNFREPPGWQSTRRAVGDFVGTCLEENINVPVSAREVCSHCWISFVLSTTSSLTTMSRFF